MTKTLFILQSVHIVIVQIHILETARHLIEQVKDLAGRNTQPILVKLANRTNHSIAEINKFVIVNEGYHNIP